MLKSTVVCQIVRFNGWADADELASCCGECPKPYHGYAMLCPTALLMSNPPQIAAAKQQYRALEDMFEYPALDAQKVKAKSFGSVAVDCGSNCTYKDGGRTVSCPQPLVIIAAAD